MIRWPTYGERQHAARERERALATQQEQRRLQPAPRPATISSMDSDPRLDTILTALGQLTTVVGSLAASVAQIADRPSDPAAPPPPTTVALTQDPGYSPLTPRSPDNQGERIQAALELGILGTPAGLELVEWGARGFYRKLEREDGQLSLNIPRHVSLMLVKQAAAEDRREGEDMSADLLKVWSPQDMPVPGVDAPTVAIAPDGSVVVAASAPI